MPDEILPPQADTRYKRIAIFALIAISISAIPAFFYYKTVRQNNVLKNELKNFIVPPVSLNNKVYTVEKGEVRLADKLVSVFTSEQVLRAAYSSVLNRLDPIFAIEGTDADKLGKSVGDLDASLKNIASAYGKENETLIKNNLYPIAFLKTLSETERARQRLILTPSAENATEYYKSLETLLGLNISYAKQLRAVYQNNKNLLNYKFGFFDGYGTIDTFSLALEGAEPEINNKIVELEKREACLDAYSSGCPSLSEALAQMSTSAAGAPAIVYEPTLEDTRDNIKIISEHLKTAPGNDSAANTNNHLIALDSSSCFPNASPVYYQSWLKSDKNKNSFFTVNFVNDIYFRTVKNNGNAFIESLEKEGIDYLYQNATNLYLCQSMGGDYSRSIAMDTIQNLLSGKPLLLGGNEKIAPDAAALESKIAAGDILYESEFNSYIEELKLILAQYGEVDLSEIIGSEKVLYMEKIISIYEQKSPRFDETVRNVISVNSIVDIFLKEGVKFNVGSLFMTRGYPPLLLLSYNESAYKKPMDAVQFETFDITNFKLVSYNKFLKGKYGVEKTIELMQLGRKLFRKE